MYIKYKRKDLDLPGFSNLGQTPYSLLLGQRPLDYDDAKKIINANLTHAIKYSLNTDNPVYKYINPQGVFDNPAIVNAFKSAGLPLKNLSGISDIFPANSLLYILMGLGVFFLIV